ncbi:MAG TPA: universal stress protein, partial [Actinomycetota bacterium]|nr:universal stress protein [Actinomycetota bacterium]
PDAFVRAGEVKLVDLPPAALRRRLAQGFVVPADGVGTALSHYFRFANLAALRELAQLWMDQSVPDAASAYAGLHGTGGRDSGRVVVGLDGSSKDEWLIRYGANVAGLGGESLSGVYVKPADGRVHPTTQLQADRRLLDDLGGTFAEVTADNPATGLVRAARRAGATQLVIGSPAGAWLSRIVHGSMARRVLRAAGDDLPVQLVCVGDKPPSSIA